MLEVHALSKRFGDVTALDGVSFSLDEGEIVGLLGENGAGKTTTLRLLSGGLMPNSGRVSIAGRDLFSDVVATRRKVGYLPETLPIDTEMRVLPFLDYVARLKGLNRAERADGIERVLNACGLEELTNRGIGVLSRGGRMRVALAQALVHNPEVLLLDEPTSGLDPQQVLRMRELILSLSGHHTILFSSHNLTEVAAVCNRIVFLKQGRLVAEDVLSTVSEGAEQILLRFSSAPSDMAILLSALPVVSGVEPVPGGGPGAVSVRLKSGEGVREQLAERVAMMGWGLCEMRPMSGNLPAFFQHHAGGGDAASTLEVDPSTLETIPADLEADNA
jgi:ABC-2 type transport system ATP-binding protein